LFLSLSEAPNIQTQRGTKIISGLGGEMNIRTRIIPAVPVLLVAGLWLAPSLMAAETTPVQCAANDDRVWVYDSLTSFTVELRLKCGDPVEVVGRAKGYVKIRTADGKEGYVPDAALPGVPPYQDPQTFPVEGLASLVRARKAAAAPPSAAITPAAPPAISANATAKPMAATHEATAVMTIEPLPASESASSTGGAAPTANVKPVSVAPKRTAKPAVKKPVPAPSQPPAPPVTTATTASLVPPAGAKSNAQVAYLSSNSANTSPRIESAVEKSPVAITANTSMKQPAAASMRPVADSESEDEPDSLPVDQSADPSCRVFFSAYGLAPAQYRWIAQNRQQKYPGICPAAGPSQVDFVMIFTHDIEIFNSTLPDAVHVDKNGFSDFSPLTMVDSALMPEAYADKAHHQYVWVFRMKRGAFDPAKFSPRRRFQFTKQESSSHSTDRAAEDAFQFIEEQGTTR
jgi:hypothetical protein